MYWIFIGVLFCVLTVIFSAFRYSFLLGHIGEKLDLFKSTLIILSTQIVKFIVPFKIGTISKPIITKILTGISIKKSSLICIFEEISEIIWELLLIPFLLFALGRKFIANYLFIDILFFIFFIFLLIIFILKIKYFIFLMWKFKIFIPEFIKRKLRDKINREKVNFYFDEFLSFSSNRKVLFYYIIFIIILILTQPLVLYASLKYFNVNLDYLLILVFYWASFIIGRVSGIPGGFGSRDLSLTALIVTQNVSFDLALKITVLYRLIAIVPIIILGIGPLLSVIFPKFKKLKIKGLL